MNQEKILKEFSGVFDGKAMVVSENCSIMVPENYASKSMLISGTKMIYRVTDQMSYFKQTSVESSRTALGKVVEIEPGELRVEANIDGYTKWFKFLHAFETYWKLEAGNEVVFIYPEFNANEENYCAIENKLS